MICIEIDIYQENNYHLIDFIHNKKVEEKKYGNKLNLF